MTPEQLNTLRTACFADPTAAAFIAAGDAAGLRGYLNAAGTKIVWKGALSFAEVLGNLVAADWQQFDNLSNGQVRIWDNLARLGSIDMSNGAHQAAVAECWKGTAAKAAVATRIIALGKRAATRAEGMLATGAGTTNDPATITFQGEVQETEGVQLVFKDDGTIWTL